VTRRAFAVLAGTVALLVAACGGGSDDVSFDDTVAPNASGASTTPSAPGPTGGVASGTAPTGPTPADAELPVTIEAGTPGAAISPQILGVSSDLTAAELADAGLQVNSWGGNPATRYNYVVGNAWNHGSDWEFRNTNYGSPPGPQARLYVESNEAAGVATRLAVPTLGWVAKNDEDGTCSFPSGDGCLPAADVGDCANPRVTADPTTANTPSTPEGVAEWVGGMIAAGLPIQYIAMDNEPDLWGYTHFDVHPACATYEEVLDRYLTYAEAVREVAPDSLLAGPVMCCWYDYWHIAPGPADGSGTAFLDWFLDQVRQHDEASGTTTLDVVDVHYYPQGDLFNDNVDPETSARRLRSTRSLWDPGYIDESWINERITFIPRMKETIERSYPGRKLFISEWNFGGESDINGALAIAEVLGIYGREGVDAATYWRNPPVGSPGWFGFKIYGNYDDAGSSFGGAVVPATTTDPSRVGSYAALDPDTGVLRVMLVNKDPDAAVTTRLDLTGFAPAAEARRFTYGPADLSGIVSDTVGAADALTLPASSITLVELEPAS
jgi:hypothetical protein